MADAHAGYRMLASSPSGWQGDGHGRSPDPRRHFSIVLGRLCLAEPMSVPARQAPRSARQDPSIRRWVPPNLNNYQKRWLCSDLVAGVTLAAVAIPECMGYTKIIGAPVVTGL